MPERRSGAFVEGAHTIDYPVYYEDTDAGGVMYYGNYLRFAERARTEALNLAGISHVELMKSHGVWFVVRRCVVDYFLPARLDDIITVRTTLHEMRNTSMMMRQEFLLGIAGKREAESEKREVGSETEWFASPERRLIAETSRPEQEIKQKPGDKTIIAVVDAFVVCVNTAVKPNKIPDPVRTALAARMPIRK